MSGPRGSRDWAARLVRGGPGSVAFRSMTGEQRTPLPLFLWLPPTQLGSTPTGGPAASRVPGKGAPGGRLWGTHLRAASRGGAGRGGRGRGPLSRPPTAGLSRAPGSPARPQVAQSAGGSRPPGPAPHPAHRCWGRLGGPGSPHPGSDAVLRWPPPAFALPVAPLLGRSSQAREGPVLRSLARGRESPTPRSHPRAGPPSWDPQEKTDWSAGPGSPQPPSARAAP